MTDVTIIYNKNKEKKRSGKLIQYPDGVTRLLTLRAYEWEWVNMAVDDGYPFNEILRCAQNLAVEFPTSKGYDTDVLHSTRYMLMVIVEGFHEEKHPAANEKRYNPTLFQE